jgi:hypothetical protein
MINGLALTCKFPVWHSWEGPETATGAYGIWCKPTHTVHVVNNFNFNFNFAPSTSEPIILVMYGFILSIHGLMLGVTLILYFGLDARPLVGKVGVSVQSRKKRHVSAHDSSS